MGLWDLHPGYLSDRDLKAEHRAVHRLFRAIDQNQTARQSGRQRQRFEGHLGGLVWRHRLLTAEMDLRGLGHRSPLAERPGDYPGRFTTSPTEQFQQLRRRYAEHSGGRIDLPKNPQTLWAQYKYSILARDPVLYQQLGPQLAQGQLGFAALAEALLVAFCQRPTEGGLINAYQHMLGYFSQATKEAQPSPQNSSIESLRNTLRLRLKQEPIVYLLQSTMLAEP
ncbi:MAG: DUF1722 domain-containing protein [bacterium]|nr:DUF1722 domain-containing protein [bacterium]